LAECGFIPSVGMESLIGTNSSDSIGHDGDETLSQPLPRVRVGPREDSLGSVFWRHALLGIGFLVAYVALSQSGVLLETQLGFTVWYPPVGLSFALLLSVSPWYAALMVLGDSISSHLLYHQSLLSWSVLVGTPGIALCYAVGATILRGHWRIDYRLGRRKEVMQYVAVSLSAAAVASFFGVSALWLDGTITKAQILGSTLRWYSGDAIALVAVAPFLLIYVSPAICRWLRLDYGDEKFGDRLKSNPAPKSTHSTIELVAQGASIVVALWAMFAPFLALLRSDALGLLPIIWMGMRQGVRRAVAGILLLNFGIVLAIHVSRVDPAWLPRFGALMLIGSFTGLLVGASASERHWMGQKLQEQALYLNSLIQNSPVGIVVLARDGHVQLCNGTFVSLFGLENDQVVGRDLDALLAPHSADRPLQQVSAEIFRGRSVRQTVHHSRHDHVALDLELNAVPLLRDGRVEAAYFIYKDVTERVKAETATRQQAETLKNWVRELQRRTKETSLLSEMGNLLLCCANGEEAYQVVDNIAKQLFPEALSGVFYEFKSSRNVLEATASWGQPVSRTYFSPEACWGLRRGQPYWSDSRSISCSHTKTSGTQDLCVPMVAQGDALGILNLRFPEATEETRQSWQGLATAVAGQIALSLANLKLRETLRDQSIRDPLTGLFNRRFMQESLNRELQRAGRRKRPLSVLFVHLDHFKRFNDTFGHEAGDLVLSAVAVVFQRNFRGDDVICRYGGEEFAIILPEASTKDAAKRADALRLEVNNMRLSCHSRPLDPVTVSVGVATFPENGTTVDALMQQADRALYQSKANGRDRVTVAEWVGETV
jgi:diguanylate cyclase (GGDEF)-like protein/PAS domain S-box-containing protein